MRLFLCFVPPFANQREDIKALPTSQAVDLRGQYGVTNYLDGK